MARTQLTSLRESLMEAVPDCFDCGLRVIAVETDATEAPFKISVSFVFTPDDEGEVDESVHVAWSGLRSALETWSEERGHFEEQIIHAMGEVVDGYRW